MVHFNAARWFLFILFWIIWTGMLAAAVVIIVLAPKCPSPDPKVGSTRIQGFIKEGSHFPKINPPPLSRPALNLKLWGRGRIEKHNI